MEDTKQLNRWTGILPLDSPEPGKPMHHDLLCGICGHPFSHTDPWMTRCGLCAAKTASTAARSARSAIVWV